MGLLGNFDFLPEDQQKREAARAGLLQFGASMLGGTGNFGQILGQGIQHGAQGYHSTLAQQQQKALRDLQTKQLGLENQKLQAGIDEPMELAKIAAGAGSGLRPLGAPAAAGGIAPVLSLPQVGQAKAAPAPATSEAKPVDQYQYYLGLSQAYSSAGKMTAAKTAMEMADKLKPKLKEQQSRTVDGKRVLANVYEDGRTEQVQGFAPDAEKLNFQNTGGATMAFDPYTGQPVNTIKNTQSPDSAASVGATIRGQNMTDSRARDTLEAGRNQVVQSDDGPVLVNTRTGTGKTIMAPDGNRLAGVLKPLNDAQSKAYLFGTRMQESNRVLGQLATAENGKTTTSHPLSRAPVIGSVVNAFQGENRQMLDQAKRDFMSAVLRRESGAAIAESEYVNADKQYFPQIGDSSKVIEQKARNRQLAIDGIMKEVPEKHRPTVPSVDALPKKAPAGPQPGAVQGGYRFKGGNPADKSNWEKA